MISVEELIAEMRRLADSGEPPTKREFQEQSKYSYTTVWRKFGSWNEALIESGYQPHIRMDISEKVLLEQLTEDISGEVAPAYVDFDGKYNPDTYSRRFGSWWRACVQAGFKPSNHRPLTRTQSRKYFQTAVNQQDAKNRLIGLIAQFTGLTPDLLPKLSQTWATFRDGDVIVTVPSTETSSEDSWTFQLPEVWTDRNQRRDTELPGLVEWYLQTHGSIEKTPMDIRNTLYRVARDAGLEERVHIKRANIGTVPLVRPTDLRMTGGIQMARNGAPARRIRRHLGIEHTGWEADVEDFFLWLYVHEDYQHPEYNPPDVVLDPVES